MSFDPVFFGGTGDLTWRRLVPASFQALRHRKLPPGGRILAVARDERSDEARRTCTRICGRPNLFVRSDEQEQAWRRVEPSLHAWAADPIGPRPDAPGSWGPPASSAMVARDGCTWDEEQ